MLKIPPDNPEDQINFLLKEVAELRAAVEGPNSGLLERVELLEDKEAAPQLSSLAGPGPSYETPAVVTDFIDESDEQEPVIEDLLPFEMEFGKPTANVTSDSATVTMQPCAQDGTSFASANEATVYVANDRSIQDIAGRGWTTSTILSFYRFSPFFSDTPNIEGVLIGGGPVTDGEIVTAADKPDSPIIYDEWHDIQGDEAWFDIDTRDWSGRFVKVVALYDGGAPVDGGSWNETQVFHYESWFGVATQQEEYKWFRLYLNSSVSTQNITKIDTDIGGSSTTLIEFRMGSDGHLQMQVTSFNIRTSVRITIEAFNRREASDAIVVS